MADGARGLAAERPLPSWDIVLRWKGFTSHLRLVAMCDNLWCCTTYTPDLGGLAFAESGANGGSRFFFPRWYRLETESAQCMKALRHAFVHANQGMPADVNALTLPMAWFVASLNGETTAIPATYDLGAIADRVQREEREEQEALDSAQ